MRKLHGSFLHSFVTVDDEKRIGPLRGRMRYKNCYFSLNNLCLRFAVFLMQHSSVKRLTHTTFSQLVPKTLHASAQWFYPLFFCFVLGRRFRLQPQYLRETNLGNALFDNLWKQLQLIIVFKTYHRVFLFISKNDNKLK